MAMGKREILVRFSASSADRFNSVECLIAAVYAAVDCLGSP